jgi:outer membrane lipoprotein-sorting protein
MVKLNNIRRDPNDSRRSHGYMMKTKLASLAFLLFLLSAYAKAQNLDQLLTKIFVARGGMDRILAVDSERISGHIAFGEISGPFVVELKRPLKMHMQLTVQNMTMVRVYDGKSGWANNPFEGKLNPDEMSEQDLKNINEEADFDGPLVDYKEKGNKIELVGKEKFKDKDVWRLKLTTKNGDTRYYVYDADSFLLLKWEGQRRYGDKQLPVETFFSNYRDVNGLRFPFQLDSGSSETDITQKVTIENIELNPEINDAEFAKPAGPPSPQSLSATPKS